VLQEYEEQLVKFKLGSEIPFDKYVQELKAREYAEKQLVETRDNSIKRIKDLQEKLRVLQKNFQKAETAKVGYHQWVKICMHCMITNDGICKDAGNCYYKNLRQFEEVTDYRDALISLRDSRQCWDTEKKVVEFAASILRGHGVYASEITQEPSDFKADNEKLTKFFNENPLTSIYPELLAELRSVRTYAAIKLADRVEEFQVQVKQLLEAKKV
jgi:hypothetical protein